MIQGGKLSSSFERDRLMRELKRLGGPLGAEAGLPESSLSPKAASLSKQAQIEKLFKAELCCPKLPFPGGSSSALWHIQGKIPWEQVKSSFKPCSSPLGKLS